MENFKDNWLPNLKGSVPPEAYGYTVSMYSIALEGWRRGLTLKYINNNQRRSEIDYSLTHKGKERRFSVTRGDVIPRKAIRICINKDLTKKYLVEAGVPTPEGEIFNEQETDNRIFEYGKSLGYPLVIKPSNGTAGAGVIANIKNDQDFKEAISYVRSDLNYPKVIVEKFFRGEDYRLYVIGDKVVAACIRIPANVVGNGRSTIKQLLNNKNAERDNTPALHKRLIKVDKEMHNILRSEGYTLDSVPEKGKKVFLKTKSNVSAGGDSIDVTDKLTDEIKSIAIQASKAIPGLVQCGVDVIADKENNTGAVLEVNSRPHITAHLYPWEGKARDIPKAIIDYYFPETIPRKVNNQSAYYFDFKSVFDSFQGGVAKEITVPNIPNGNLEATRFIVSGEIGRKIYEGWVRKQARDLKLNGYIKQLGRGGASVVVSGPKESVIKFRSIIKRPSSRVKVTNVVEKKRDAPVKIGFEIKKDEVSKNTIKKEKKTIRQDVSKDGYFPIRLKNTTRKKVGKSKDKKIKSTTKRYKKLQKERNYYKKKYEDMQNSRAWKATKPIRKIGKLIKGSKNTKKI